LRSSVFALLLTTLFSVGCSAQSQSDAGASAGDASLKRKIELQVRSFFNVPPNVNITIGGRSASEVPGYDKLEVTLNLGTRTNKVPFLISKDNKTLVRWEKMDLDADPMKAIDVNGRPWRGNKDSKVTIVNYDDFQCPFCARMHQTLFPKILKDYGDQVKIIYKDFPLTSIHPWAMRAAVDANCLAAQNNDAYWDFADYAHSNQKEISGDRGNSEAEFSKLDQITSDIGKKRGVDPGKLNACMKQQSETAVRESMLEADHLGVESTPTLFINGEKIAGAYPEEQLRIIIDRAIRAAGGKVPEPKPASTP
jgi:protein-disulfide isomerase